MINKSINSKLLSLTISLFIIFFFAQNDLLEAAGSKDLILVVDTSLTMVGKGGGRNILPQVKESLPKFINQLEEDDSISFMTFETNVNMYPTIYIDDENDKDIINKYISAIEAKGKWTYTSLMLKNVLGKAQELEDKDPERQRVIVIMTDSLDDPPPGMRQDRLRIDKVEGTKKYSEKDWFILVMNFGEAKKNKNLARQLAGISKYSKIIDATKKDITKKEQVQDAIEKGLKENIEELTAKKDEGTYPINTILIAVIIIAILLAALFFLKRMAELKVYGKLDYWDHTMISPYQKTFDLTKQNTRGIVIGKQGNLRISEIEINAPFIITAVRDNGEIKNAIISGKGYNIEFANRDPGRFLQGGDIFKVANYTFRYVS